MNQHYQDIKEQESNFAIEEAERLICSKCNRKLLVKKSIELKKCVACRNAFVMDYSTGATMEERQYDINLFNSMQ